MDKKKKSTETKEVILTATLVSAVETVVERMAYYILDCFFE